MNIIGILSIFPILMVCGNSFNDQEEYLDYIPETSDYSSQSESGNYTTKYLLTLTGKEQSRFKSWQIRTLDYINRLRERGNLPPLTMNEQLHREVQEWTKKVVCKGVNEQNDIRGFRANKFKMDLQREYKSPAVRSKTKLFRRTVTDWFGQSRDFDCAVPISLGDMYAGADNFQKVRYYSVIMGEQYEKVGFGIAICPDTDSVLVIARFDYDVSNFYKLVAKEMKRQRLRADEIFKLDMSKFVACPDYFRN